MVASGNEGTVKFFNDSTYAIEQTLSSLDDADNVRFDAADGTVYVGYGDGALAVIDVSAAKQTAVLKLFRTLQRQISHPILALAETAKAVSAP